MTFDRFGHTATSLLSGKILIAGGRNMDQFLTSCEIFDPASNKWSPAANMSTPRYQHTATLLTSGKVLVSGSESTSLGEVYDSISNTWNPIDNDF
jgi:TATA-box binding protein (TBP) (component of TFIID and TFIIIB)